LEYGSVISSVEGYVSREDVVLVSMVDARVEAVGIAIVEDAELVALIKVVEVGNGAPRATVRKRHCAERA
jgi:hypothetical protein